MAFGEIDGALVRVRDARAAYASSPFQGKKKASSSSEHLSTVSLKKKEETTSSSPPPVEVLAVFECKRNPDDARRGFLRRRADLLWLAGDETKNAYDPKRYANKHHPTGHFTCGYHPVRRMEPVMRVDSFGERRDEVLGAADDSEETKRVGPAEVSEKKEKGFRAGGRARCDQGEFPPVRRRRRRRRSKLARVLLPAPVPGDQAEGDVRPRHEGAFFCLRRFRDVFWFLFFFDFSRARRTEPKPADVSGGR
jgi:hypothetical protein